MSMRRTLGKRSDLRREKNWGSEFSCKDSFFIEINLGNAIFRQFTLSS